MASGSRPGALLWRQKQRKDFHRWLFAALGVRRSLAYGGVLLLDAAAPVMLAAAAARSAAAVIDTGVASSGHTDRHVVLLVCMLLAGLAPLLSQAATSAAARRFEVLGSQALVRQVQRRALAPHDRDTTVELEGLRHVLGSSVGVPAAVDTAAGIVVRRTRAYAVIVLLAAVNAGWAALLLGSWLLSRYAVRQELEDLLARNQVGMTRWRLPSRLREQLFDGATLREVRCFARRGWLPGIYLREATSSMAAIWSARRVGSLRLAACHVPLAVALGLGFHSAAVTAAESLTLSLLVVQGLIITAALGSLPLDEFRFDDSTRRLSPLIALPARPGRFQALHATAPAGTAEALTLRSVSATYGESGRRALDGISVNMEPGTVTAVVGRNGAGKSTLVRVLAGVQPVLAAGSVTWGRLDAMADRRAWMSRVTWLPQEPARLPATLTANVDLLQGSPVAAVGPLRLPDVPQDELLDPLGTAGRGLSGGEWQRVAVERVLHAAAGQGTMLLLDEPTSSLDPQAEHELMLHLRDAAAGRITVVVTHRLAAARLAHQIVVLDGGQCVGKGTHDELVATCELYTALLKRQATLAGVGEAQGA